MGNAELKKLKIIAYTDNNFTTTKEPRFELMINPSNYKYSTSINYEEDKTGGSVTSSPKYKSYGDESISFDTYFDATGTISSVTNSTNSIKDQIDKLKETVYNYNGSIHEPNYNQIVWGDLIFNCRLKSFSVDYTLFKPDGTPLRAKVSLAFQGFVSKEEEAKIIKTSSPDLTHIITFKGGDSLPLLCQKIYKDSSYYSQIARINGLSNFRNIQPGTKLKFPPLRK